MFSSYKISEFMTPVPYTVHPKTTARDAEEFMRHHAIRHLPIEEDGILKGIVSERDLKLARLFRGPGELQVGDIMVRDPFVVTTEAYLDDVCIEMADNKYGSAVVTDDDGEIVGIFTNNDAARALGELIRKLETEESRKEAFLYY